MKYHIAAASGQSVIPKIPGDAFSSKNDHGAHNEEVQGLIYVKAGGMGGAGGAGSGRRDVIDTE